MFDGMSDLWKNKFAEAFEGRVAFSLDQEACQRMASDHTEDLVFMPGVVVEPSNTAEVQEVMRWAFAHDISVTTSGGHDGIEWRCTAGEWRNLLVHETNEPDFGH